MIEKNDAARPAGAWPERRGCDRAEELVTYLYGEATREEAGLFRTHLDECAVCREEFEALGGVRASVGVWRAEALGSLPALNIEEALAPSARHNVEARTAPARRRSARAALREFYKLSPLWLRAGAFAATLAVCALLALTLARGEVRWGADGLAFRSGVSERIVREQVPVQTGYTDEQVNALVARKVAEAQAQFAAEAKRQTHEQSSEQIINATAGGVNPQPPQSSAPNSTRRKRTPRRAQGRDDSLLAEDNLPRLSDLLSGSY